MVNEIKLISVSALRIDAQKTGWKENPKTHKWEPPQASMSGGYLPATNAQTYEQYLDYSKVRKIR